MSDLAALRFGVRIDQPGTAMVDFQTAQNRRGDPMPLSRRHFLSDAAFLAGVEGELGFIETLQDAVEAPMFPLFLGRRGYPATLPLSLGVREFSLRRALEAESWVAAEWYQKRLARQLRAETVSLELVLDAVPGEIGESVRDVPISFAPEYRRYGWRDVIRLRVEVTNPEYKKQGPEPPPVTAGSSSTAGDDPDWIAAIGGSNVPV